MDMYHMQLLCFPLNTYMHNIVTFILVPMYDDDDVNIQLSV